MGFPTKNDHFGVFWGYHHLRKHPHHHILKQSSFFCWFIHKHGPILTDLILCDLILCFCQVWFALRPATKKGQQPHQTPSARLQGWELKPTSSNMMCMECRLAKTSRRTFFRACVFTIFLPHLWNGFIFFCGIYNVFLVPCIVLVSEMLSFTMVTKLNDILIWKLHRFVLYEVVSKASRGSLLQQWFIRFPCVFPIQCFPKTSFYWMPINAITDPHLFSTLRNIHKSRKQWAVASAKLEERLLDQRHCHCRAYCSNRGLTSPLLFVVNDFGIADLIGFGHV